MKLIKLIIPFDVHMKTKQINGHFVYFLDLETSSKPLIIANNILYHDIWIRNKYWNSEQIREQNAIELSHANENLINSIAKILCVSNDEIEPNYKKSIIKYFGKGTRIWNFCLARFLKNEFDYSWIKNYAGHPNRDSIITCYAKKHGINNINIKDIPKKSLIDFINENVNTLENICKYNQDLYEYLAEQKGYQLNNPNATPEIRAWLITKYSQNANEINEIIKAKSQFWAKWILSIYKRVNAWFQQKYDNQKMVEMECMQKIQPYLNIANNILLNWIAFWKFQGLIKEKKLNSIYSNLFSKNQYTWIYTKKIINLFENENWNEIATYLKPNNIAWLPIDIGKLLNDGVLKLVGKGKLLNENNEELSPEQLQQLLKVYSKK